jgi:hypothetical protein
VVARQLNSRTQTALVRAALLSGTILFLNAACLNFHDVLDDQHAVSVVGTLQGVPGRLSTDIRAHDLFFTCCRNVGSLCGCLTYTHPYDSNRSGWAEFVSACVCPTSLAANEQALHALSRADGRTGILSGQYTCCQAEDGESKSARAAAKRMQITGWFALFLPLLWPLLALLSFLQRRHVVKVRFL